MTNSHKQQSLLQPFETERLIITPLTPEHQALYISLYTDAKIMRKIAPPLTREQAQACFELALSHNQRQPAKQLTWVIIDKQTDQTVGIEGLTFNNNQPEQAEIGIMLTRLANGKNYPAEAMGALTEFSLINKGITQINAVFQTSNKATLQFVKKLGYVKFEQSHIYQVKQEIEHYIMIPRLLSKSYLINSNKEKICQAV